jgi:hypothetical protein
MNAREAILGRLRATSIPALPTLPDLSGWYAVHTRDEDRAQRVARLCAAMRAVKTEIHAVTPGNWVDGVAADRKPQGITADADRSGHRAR